MVLAPNSQNNVKIRSALRILPEEAPLRQRSPFLEIPQWQDDSPGPLDSGQPRALRGLARIVDGGLCHRCGTCIGICPTAVLALDAEGYPRVQTLSACTDCDLCVKVCPGDEFDFHKHHQERYGRPGYETETLGEFREAIVAHTTDPDLRERSTSGGLVTALLLEMLERGEIDGAMTIASDEGSLWKGKPVIARTREQIVAAMKSKYAISPTNALFSEIREIPGRYAMVGLPCQIHGFVKAAALDERIRERVVLTIGLFCHAAIEHQAFEVIWDTLGDKGKRAKRFVSRIGKHPGSPHIELEDGSLYPVYFGDKKGYRPTSIEMINILYRLYTPSRCMTCFDASSEFADIAVGDPWMAPPEDFVDFYDGWSFALIRSERAQKLCAEMIASDKIGAVSVTRREALACNELMATEKRWRAFRVIETLRRQGKPVPRYHMVTPTHTLVNFIRTEFHMLTHILCYLPNLREKTLRFMLSSRGYVFLWLNDKRRAFRFWRRDSWARISRRIFGRR